MQESVQVRTISIVRNRNVALSLALYAFMFIYLQHLLLFGMIFTISLPILLFYGPFLYDVRHMRAEKSSLIFNLRHITSGPTYLSNELHFSYFSQAFFPSRLCGFQFQKLCSLTSSSSPFLTGGWVLRSKLGDSGARGQAVQWLM